MALLRITLIASVLAMSACYAPQLRDCAVTCASEDDCAPGQVCGTDRWCAAPELAGRCANANAIVDARPESDATFATDAPPPIDAPGAVVLVIQIMGKGSVTLVGGATCPENAPGHQCTFAVVAGVTRQLVAVDGNDSFESWTTAPCMGQDATCTLTPIAATTTAAVRFQHGGGQ